MRPFLDKRRYAKILLREAIAARWRRGEKKKRGKRNPPEYGGDEKWREPSSLRIRVSALAFAP
jgi:hypothetical protein